MKKLLSVFFSLALICALAAPALADAYPQGYTPEEVADRALEDFDPPMYTWEGYASLEQVPNLDTYRSKVLYLKDFLAAHPEVEKKFDADAFFDQSVGNPDLGITKEFWMALNEVSEEEFRPNMFARYLDSLYRSALAQPGGDFPARYPSEFAAFDADAWFAGYYGGILGVSKARYMETEGLTGEGDFRAALFAEWAVGPLSRFNGLVVTVDGTPIQFQAVRTDSWEVAEPVARDGRILVPLRTVAQAMNCAVAYDGAARTAICTKGDVTVTFTLDSTAYSVVSPNGITALSLAVPATARDGRTYVPLRALGEALGYTVTWNAPFQTAALTAG